jgi:nucleotide-binding universal stress UspA family protein
MTVVVGVDNSGASGTALRLAAQEAQWRHARLVAVSAYEPPLGTPVGGYPSAALHTAGEERAVTESALRATVTTELDERAADTDLRVSEGLAGRVIIETAEQTNAQLIVLAASVGKWMLPGTVSQYVLFKARCPVMLVPAHDAAGRDAGQGRQQDEASQHNTAPSANETSSQ